MILTKKRIPMVVGVILVFLAVGVVATHIYFYIGRNKDTKLKGFHVDPKDPRFDPINGVGGVGWV